MDADRQRRIMSEANSLYLWCGFRECAPYVEAPEQLMPHLVFMELDLA